MIQPISFSGKVYLTGGVTTVAKPEEVSRMQAYANKNNCDIVVMNRDYYIDGTGKYETILVQEDEDCGKNFFDQRVFDFCKNQGFSELPKFKHMVHPKLR